MFNLFVCCSTLLKVLENLLVTTGMSLSFQVYGEIQQVGREFIKRSAREFFLVLFFLPFSYESRQGPHS